MHHPGPVRGRQPFGHLNAVLQCLFHRQPLRRLGQHRPQVPPVHQFPHQERAAVVFPGVQHRRDRRVIHPRRLPRPADPRRSPRPGRKPRRRPHLLRVAHPAGFQHLHCHRTFPAQIPAPPGLAKPAPAQQFFQPVTPRQFRP